MNIAWIYYKPIEFLENELGSELDVHTIYYTCNTLTRYHDYDTRVGTLHRRQIIEI